MYQLSQAMASGTVKLMDWNSVVNAGMGGELFKTALEKTAESLGKGRNMAVSFRDSLQDGWITTEVLTKTLQQFADDPALIQAATQVKTFTQLFDTMKESVQSGWATTWENIIGNKEEAAAMLTAVNNVFNGIAGSSADSRNKILKQWHDFGGRDAVLKGLVSAFKGMESIVLPIKDAFREIFPATTGMQLILISQAFRDLMAKFKLGDKTLDKIKRTAKGFFALLDIGAQFIKALVKGIAGILKYILPAGDGILSFTAGMGDMLVAFDEAIKKSDFFTVALKKIGDFLKPLADGIKIAIGAIVKVFDSLGDIDLSGVDSFSNRVTTRFEPLSKVLLFFQAIFEGVGKFFKKFAPIFFKLGEIIGVAFGKLQDALAEGFDTGNFDSIFDLINGGLFAAILLGIKKFIGSLTGITDGTGDFVGKIKGIFGGVKDSLSALQSSLKSKILMNIAIAIGILAASLLVLSLIDSDKLTTSLAAISALFLDLFGSMGVFEKIMGGKGFQGMTKITTAMIGLSVAILILSFAMANLARLDWDGIKKGLVGIGSLMAMLLLVSVILSKTKSKLIKGSVGIILFATAILILTQSVKQLGAMDIDDLAKGLGGVAILLATIAGFSQLVKPTKIMFIGTAMVVMGASMLIFAKAVEQLGTMDIKVLIKGLGSIAILLAIIAGFSQIVKPSKIIFIGTALVVMAASILILTQAVKQLGNLDLKVIAKGLGSIIIILAAIAGFSQIIKPKKLLGTSLAMAIMGAAILIFAKAVKQLGELDTKSLIKGIVALAVLMAAIAAFTRIVKPDKLLAISAAMVIMGTGLLMMAQVLKTLGSMSLKEIVLSMVALAGIFLVLGVAAFVLKPLVPTILLLAGAIALLGVGIALIGVGILAFSAGLTAFALGASSLAAGIVIIVSAVLGLIPLLFQKIGEGIIELCKVIIDGAPAIKDAVVVLLESALEALTECAPMVADALIPLLLELLTTIDKYLPDITDKLFSIVTKFLEKVAEKLPELITAAAKVLSAFLDGVFGSMGGYKPENLLGALSCFTLLIANFVLLAASKKFAKDAIVATGAMILVMGLIAALFMVISALNIEDILSIALSLSSVLLAISAAMLILSFVPVSGALTAIAGLAIFVAGMAAILAVLGGLAQIPGFDWLMSEGSKVLGEIGTAIGSFVGNIAGGFLNGVSASFPQIGADLSSFMTNATPFIEGAKNIDKSTMEGIKALAEVILVLTAADILDGLTSWITGGSSITDFGKELCDFAPYFKEYADSVKDIDGDTVIASANAAKALCEFANNAPNSGGVAGWIMGENGLSDFADELVVFGPKLKEYAKSVKGLDADAVTNSATAAQAICEFANNVPNSGGALGWVMGENGLSAFADELVVFGPKLQEYADSVRGLDTSIVTNSTNAAQALCEFADNVPNSGGVAGWFAGENNVSDFAGEIEVLGPKLKAYADSVKGLDSKVVTNSTNAAMALCEFANNIPNSGGALGLLVGENGVSAFADELVLFGPKFKTYADSIKNIDIKSLSNVVDQIASLADIASIVAKTDTSKLQTFSDDLNAMGDIGVDGFTSAFTESYSDIETAVTTMLNFVAKALKAKQSIATDATTALVEAMATVMTTKTSSVTSTTKTMMDKMVSAIEDYRDSFENAGAYLVDGFIEGINSKASKAVAAASAATASGALKATKRVLEEKSPSKAFERIGKYGVLGLANGFSKYASIAADASADAGQKSITSMSKIIGQISDSLDSNMDLAPTIRPVLDMSDIQNGSKVIDGMFTQRHGIQVASIMPRINSIAARTTNPSTEINRNPEGASSAFNFVQNNYSPTPLSRLDIYRQTKNQFSAMKGLVNK